MAERLKEHSVAYVWLSDSPHRGPNQPTKKHFSSERMLFVCLCIWECWARLDLKHKNSRLIRRRRPLVATSLARPHPVSLATAQVHKVEEGKCWVESQGQHGVIGAGWGSGAMFSIQGTLLSVYSNSQTIVLHIIKKSITVSQICQHSVCFSRPKMHFDFIGILQ